MRDKLRFKKIKKEYKSYSDIATNKNSQILDDIQWLIKNAENLELELSYYKKQCDLFFEFYNFQKGVIHHLEEQLSEKQRIS